MKAIHQAYLLFLIFFSVFIGVSYFMGYVAEIDDEYFEPDYELANDYYKGSIVGLIILGFGTLTYIIILLVKWKKSDKRPLHIKTTYKPTEKDIPIHKSNLVKSLKQECPFCKSVLKYPYELCQYCGWVKESKKVKTEEKRSRTIPKSVQREVWRRDMGRCVECGTKERLEYDHIIPFSRGGSNTVRNIQLLCEKCNREKYNRIGG